MSMARHRDSTLDEHPEPLGLAPISSIVSAGSRAGRAGVFTRLMRELRGARRGTRGRPIVLCSWSDTSQTIGDQ